MNEETQLLLEEAYAKRDALAYAQALYDYMEENMNHGMFSGNQYELFTNIGVNFQTQVNNILMQTDTYKVQNGNRYTPSIYRIGIRPGVEQVGGVVLTTNSKERLDNQAAIIDLKSRVTYLEKMIMEFGVVLSKLNNNA